MIRFAMIFVLVFSAASASAQETRHTCGTGRFVEDAVRLAEEWGVGAEAWFRAGDTMPRIEYEVGDTKTLFASIGNRMIPATLRVKGTHCYFWAADANWDGSITQGQLERMRAIFDDSTGADANRGSYEIDVEAFGDPPDIDNDDRIHILVYNIGEGSVGGYFWPGNEYPTSVQPNSNELDMFYMDDGLDPAASDFGASVMAHEFQHMINWFHDNNEELWLNEGLSGLAEYLSGYLNAGGWAATWAQHTDGSLTDWEPSEGDYFRNAIFCIYMFEQFGGTEFTRLLEDEPVNGRAGIVNVLQELNFDIDFTQLFKNWTLANLLDISDPEYHNGAYGYETINLPVGPGMAQVHTTYPVDVVYEQADAWGVDYIRLENGALIEWVSEAPFSNFRSLEILEVRYSFDQDRPIVTDRGIVENTLVLDLNGFGGEFQRVVMTACNTSDNIPMNYQEFTQVHPQEPSMLPGWPLEELGVLYSSPTYNQGLLSVADQQGTIHLLNSDGSPVDGWPLEISSELWATPTVMDLVGDASPEVLAGSRSGEVHLFDLSGETMPGWPVAFPASTYGVPSPVTVFDLDADGTVEILATSFSGEVGCWSPDGDSCEGWPTDIGAPLFSGTAVGDLNGDGMAEVVIGAMDNTVHVLDRFGVELPGWPQNITGRPWGAPVLARLHPADPPAIIVSNEEGTVTAFGPDGTVLPGWPTDLDDDDRIQAPIAAGDLDGDGTVEIVAGTMSGEVHLLDSEGQELPGWPRWMEDEIWGSPLIVDMDDDGVQDIAVASKQGRLSVFALDGSSVDLWPLLLGEGAQAGPAVADVNNDGTAEILLPGLSGTFRVWDLQVDYDEMQAAWPQTGHDAGHSNSLLLVQPQTADHMNPQPRLKVLSIGPQPAQRHIRLRIAGARDILRLSVFDHAGRQRMKLSVKNPSEWVDLPLESLPSGSFILHMADNNGGSVKRPIVVLH